MTLSFDEIRTLYRQAIDPGQVTTSRQPGGTLSRKRCARSIILVNMPAFLEKTLGLPLNQMPSTLRGHVGQSRTAPNF